MGSTNVSSVALVISNEDDENVSVCTHLILLSLTNDA